MKTETYTLSIEFDGLPGEDWCTQLEFNHDDDIDIYEEVFWEGKNMLDRADSILIDYFDTECDKIFKFYKDDMQDIEDAAKQLSELTSPLINVEWVYQHEIEPEVDRLIEKIESEMMLHAEAFGWLSIRDQNGRELTDTGEEFQYFEFEYADLDDYADKSKAYSWSVNTSPYFQSLDKWREFVEELAYERGLK